MTEKIIPDTLNFEITDFSYDILNDNILKVNIEFTFDAQKDESREDIVEDVEKLLDTDTQEIDKIVNEENNDNAKEDDETIDDDSLQRIDKDDEKTIIDSINQNDNEYTTYHIHIIKESETIESICALYNSNANLLAEYNDLNEFKVGEKLIVVEEDE